MKRIRGIPLLVMVLLLLMMSLPSCGNRNMSRISVHARISEDNGDTVTVAWYVENLDDSPVTFDANRLAIWQTHPKEIHVVPTEARTLDPGEKLVMEFQVSGLNRTITEHLSVTAECREGTSATHRSRIPRLGE